MCNTRELAFQIGKEYERFSKYMPNIRCSVFFGGLAITQDEKTLKTNPPHIVVGTPGQFQIFFFKNILCVFELLLIFLLFPFYTTGRILQLVKLRKLDLKNLKHFVLDECDKMLEELDMRRDVQEIFKATPNQKQVLMFSATLSVDIRPLCKKFMQDVSLFIIKKIRLRSSNLYYLKLKD